jgi:hypothetical protein
LKSSPDSEETVLNNLNVTALLKSEFAPLVDRVVKRADANGDGHLSKSEFSEFLADVVRKLELADAEKAVAERGSETRTEPGSSIDK